MTNHPVGPETVERLFRPDQERPIALLGAALSGRHRRYPQRPALLLGRMLPPGPARSNCMIPTSGLKMPASRIWAGRRVHQRSERSLAHAEIIVVGTAQPSTAASFRRNTRTAGPVFLRRRTPFSARRIRRAGQGLRRDRQGPPSHRPRILPPAIEKAFRAVEKGWPTRSGG